MVRVLEETAPYSKLVEILWTALQEIRVAQDSGIEEFVTSITKSLRPWKTSKKFIEELRGWLEEAGGSRGKNSTNVARILTLPNAKGLEADFVFVIGFDEGVLPRSNIGSEPLCETSRLIYVSMTRAVEELHLFHARKRDGGISYASNKDADGYVARWNLLVSSPQFQKKIRKPNMFKARKLDALPSRKRRNRSIPRNSSLLEGDFKGTQ